MQLPLVKIENVSAFIPGDKDRNLILRDINWQILPNQKYLITGPNGSGKSTLLRLVAGELNPQAGRIEWLDQGEYSSSLLAGRNLTKIVSPAIQENCRRQNWSITGRDMFLGAWSNAPFSYMATHREHEMQIWKLLAELDAQEILELPLPAMSQGQLRLALLVRAILARPKILLLDECLDGLDSQRNNRFVYVLNNLAKDIAIIFTSHRPDNLSSWNPEKLGMKDGRLIKYSENTLPEQDHPVKLLNADCLRPGKAAVFELKNVSTYIDRELVLKNINWTIHRGENWRISGPNGSGKSTLLRLLAGDEFTAQGGFTNFWSGKRRKLATSLKEKRHAISLVSDLNQALYTYNLNTLEFVLSGLDNHIGIYREFSQSEVNRSIKIIRYFFDRNVLAKILNKPIRSLSTGQLRKLCLSRSLVNRPEILLLDEPCTGLDAGSRKEYLNLLDNLVINGIDGFKPQIIFVSHYEEDAPACINRHAHMEEGNLYII